IGGVVPVVNVKGVQSCQLVLDGATVAAIYLGDITRWHDARIRKLNPKLPLPDATIAPVYRRDGSGTNFLFSDYLSKPSPKGEKSWPITGASFILVYAVPPDPAATGEALKFFDWAYNNGANMAAELDYVPLPDSLIKQVRTTWQKEIKGAPGLASAPAGGKRM